MRRPARANISRYYYDGRVHVIPEFDGVRLVTNETCEFLHKVAGQSNPQQLEPQNLNGPGLIYPRCHRGDIPPWLFFSRFGASGLGRSTRKEVTQG